MKALGAILLFILAFGAYQVVAPKVLLDQQQYTYDTGSEVGNELCGQYGYDYHVAPNGFHSCERTADDEQRIQSNGKLSYGEGILGGNN